ncbi:hypothetical protein JXB02_04360 [Candidatus Woesearchaeota archaeon]|nr:hypothetical protein [Candidatus Woesearchaeota archaeon]
MNLMKLLWIITILIYLSAGIILVMNILGGTAITQSLEPLTDVTNPKRMIETVLLPPSRSQNVTVPDKIEMVTADKGTTETLVTKAPRKSGINFEEFSFTKNSKVIILQATVVGFTNELRTFPLPSFQPICVPSNDMDVQEIRAFDVQDYYDSYENLTGKRMTIEESRIDQMNLQIQAALLARQKEIEESPQCEVQQQEFEGLRYFSGYTLSLYTTRDGRRIPELSNSALVSREFMETTKKSEDHISKTISLERLISGRYIMNLTLTDQVSGSSNSHIETFTI